MATKTNTNGEKPERSDRQETKHVSLRASGCKGKKKAKKG